MFSLFYSSHKALFAIRDESFLETLPESYKKDFVDINPIASEKTKMLKEMLHSRFPVSVTFHFWNTVIRKHG